MSRKQRRRSRPRQQVGGSALSPEVRDAMLVRELEVVVHVLLARCSRAQRALVAPQVVFQMYRRGMIVR